MESRTILSTIVTLTLFLSAGFAVNAQPTAPPDMQRPLPDFPYTAEITTDNVYVRSGPGTNYYYCGKLNAGARVKVVGTKFSWSQIAPPEGSFSWISKQYVTVDPQNPKSGTVTGDAVRVYAGSPDVKPMHSTTMQRKLDAGDKVTLLGEEKENYYKIAPPQGAYLWVSTRYTRPVETAPAAPTPPPAQAPAPAPQQPTEETAQPEPQVQAPPDMPPAAAAEANLMREFDELKEKVDAERTKPVEEQDYTELKKALTEMAENEQARKPARYAQYLLKHIERYELAQAVAEIVEAQDKQFEKTQQTIEKMRSAQLSDQPDFGTFAVIGILQTSLATKENYFRIVDENGKTMCYAIPAGSGVSPDLSNLLGRKVGLVGDIQPLVLDFDSGAALVEFSRIELLD